MEKAATSRVTKHPDARRIEILGTALELFTARGFEATSVQMITERVGVAKGLFYHYFDSKADLLDQLARWQADEFFATLPAHAVEMEGDPLQKIRDVIGRIVQWKFEDARGMTLAYLEVMYAPENEVLRRRLISEYMFRLTPLFSEIIAEGVDRGVCDVDDPEIAAELVFSTWVGGGDRLAMMMLELPTDPSKLDPLVSRIRAWEQAVERILGIEKGTLGMYDYGYIERVFAEFAGTDGDGTGNSSADSEGDVR